VVNMRAQQRAVTEHTKGLYNEELLRISTLYQVSGR